MSRGSDVTTIGMAVHQPRSSSRSAALDNVLAPRVFICPRVNAMTASLSIACYHPALVGQCSNREGTRSFSTWRVRSLFAPYTLGCEGAWLLRNVGWIGAAERRPLGCTHSGLLAQKAGNVATPRAKSKQRTQKQVRAHCFVGGLHLGYARLAGTKAFGHFSLRQAQMFAPFPQSCG